MQCCCLSFNLGMKFKISCQWQSDSAVLPSAVHRKDLSVNDSSKMVHGSLQLWSNTSLFYPGNRNEKMKKLIIVYWLLIIIMSMSEADKLDDSTFYVCTANQKKSLLLTQKSNRRIKNNKRHDFANRTQKLHLHRLRRKTATYEWKTGNCVFVSKLISHQLDIKLGNLQRADKEHQISQFTKLLLLELSWCSTADAYKRMWVHLL